MPVAILKINFNINTRNLLSHFLVPKEILIKLEHYNFETNMTVTFQDRSLRQADLKCLPLIINSTFRLTKVKTLNLALRMKTESSSFS